MSDGKSEACKTYIEQTKLLVTLASGFLLAPAAALPLLRSAQGFSLSQHLLPFFYWAEGCLIGSVLGGYVVLGSLTGTQSSGNFDVYRPATRLASLFQVGLYLAGLTVFVLLVRAAVKA